GNAALGQMRQNIHEEFRSIFDQATNATDVLDAEIHVPRRRGNMSASTDPETFYRIHICAPFLNHLDNQLTANFTENESVLSSF
ncbi:hypothetical protein HPB47_023754, partial [Ixodes persulcatus]